MQRSGNRIRLVVLFLLLFLSFSVFLLRAEELPLHFVVEDRPELGEEIEILISPEEQISPEHRFHLIDPGGGVRMMLPSPEGVISFTPDEDGDYRLYADYTEDAYYFRSKVILTVEPPGKDRKYAEPWGSNYAEFLPGGLPEEQFVLGRTPKLQAVKGYTPLSGISILALDPVGNKQELIADENGFFSLSLERDGNWLLVLEARVQGIAYRSLFSFNVEDQTRGIAFSRLLVVLFLLSLFFFLLYRYWRNL